MKTLYMLTLLVLSFTAVKAQDIANDLILNVPFADSLYDLANASDFTVSGVVEFVADRAGNENCAVDFGPGDNTIYIDGSIENMISDSQEFSVSLWYKLSTEDVDDFKDKQQFWEIDCDQCQGSFIGIFDIQQVVVSDSNNYYGLWVDVWELKDTMSEDDAYLYFEDTTEWRHVVLTIDINFVPTVYFNNLVSVQDTDHVFDVGSSLLGHILGRDYYGSLDDLRIYNRCLTAEEVRFLHFLPATCDAADSCNIYRPTIEFLSCEADTNLVDVLVDFYYDADPNETFVLLVNDRAVAFHSYADLPVVVSDVRYFSDSLIIKVSNDLDPLCFIEGLLILPDSCNWLDSCELTSVWADNSICIDETYFSAEIDIDFTGGPANAFEFYIGNNYYGTAQASEFPLRLEYIELDSSEAIELVVRAIQQEECVMTTLIDVPDCLSSNEDIEQETWNIFSYPNAKLSLNGKGKMYYEVFSMDGRSIANGKFENTGICSIANAQSQIVVVRMWNLDQVYTTMTYLYN